MRAFAVLALVVLLPWAAATPDAAAGEPPPLPPPPPEDGPPPPPHALKGPPAQPFLRPPPAPPVVAKAYPTIVGEAVGPQNHAYWPVRVRSFDEVAWGFDEGRHVGMAVPVGKDRLAIQAGGGGIRGVDAATGKSVWRIPGVMHLWNYSTCIAGPGGIAYGGNHGSIQAVDPAGKRLWQTELRARWIHRPPALSPDGKSLYVAGDGVGLASLDAKTGLVNWLRRDFGSPWNTYVFDARGNLIVTTAEGTRSYTATGRERWRLEEKLAHLMIAGGYLIGADKASISARAASSRRVLWRWEHDSQVTGLALADNGRILVSLGSGELAALDLTGRLRWRRKLSMAALHAPVTTQGGETLVVDAAGTLRLIDSGGRVVSKIETGGAPYRWRPTVGPDGQVYVGHAQRVVCITGKERQPAPPVTASELAIVADDFVVDIWVNGEKLPLGARTMVGERHGAMTERVHVDLHEGDFIVFHVVANRLRWNGASYFGVHATDPAGTLAFVSSPKDGWYACDDVARVTDFIRLRKVGIDRAAIAPAHPWSDAPGIWRDILGRNFTGQPVWGTAPSTWIKYIVGGPGAATKKRVAAKLPVDANSRQFWMWRLSQLEKGMTRDQVMRLVPPGNPSSGYGGAGHGGGFAHIYGLSARWIVRLGFTYEHGYVGTPDLIDAAGPDGGSGVLCLITERGYRAGGWKTLKETLIAPNGSMASTRYAFPEKGRPTTRTVNGNLPTSILEPLKRLFDAPNRQYQMFVDDSKVRHPPVILKLDAYIQKAHNSDDGA